MTLTQVSTWFANARRRLKKENKMTWSPRNRTDDGSSVEGDDKDVDEEGGDDISIDLSDFDSEGQCKQPEHSKNVNENHKSKSSIDPVSPTSSSSDKGKPRIWSIADIAASKPQSIHSTNLRHKPYHIPPQHATQQVAQAAQAAASFKPWFDVQQMLHGHFNPALLAGIPNAEAFSSHPAFIGAQPTISTKTKPDLQTVQRSPESIVRPSNSSPSTLIEKATNEDNTGNSPSHSPVVRSSATIQK